MGKHRNRSRSRDQYDKRQNNNNDREMNHIREQQDYHHRMTQDQEKRNRPPKWTVVVLLENGESFSGTVVAFDNPARPKCKIFFKNESNRDLSIDADIDIQNLCPSEKEAALLAAINSQLLQLFEEAKMEFPEWLGKFSSHAGESNPFFNLDEIREEFKYKKSRFGIWRIAAQVGFFDDTRPQFAKFNKIMHLEIREPEPEQFN